MIKDGLANRIPKPDIVLGQHVIPAPAGIVGWRAGTTMSVADSWEVKARTLPWGLGHEGAEGPREGATAGAHLVHDAEPLLRPKGDHCPGEE